MIILCVQKKQLDILGTYININEFTVFIFILYLCYEYGCRLTRICSRLVLIMMNDINYTILGCLIIVRNVEEHVDKQLVAIRIGMYTYMHVFMYICLSVYTHAFICINMMEI
jgi:hypothetical protein